MFWTLEIIIFDLFLSLQVKNSWDFHLEDCILLCKLYKKCIWWFSSLPNLVFGVMKRAKISDMWAKSHLMLDFSYWCLTKPKKVLFLCTLKYIYLQKYAEIGMWLMNNTNIIVNYVQPIYNLACCSKMLPKTFDLMWTKKIQKQWNFKRTGKCERREKITSARMRLWSEVGGGGLGTKTGFTCWNAACWCSRGGGVRGWAT